MVFPSWFLRTLLAGAPVGRWTRWAAWMGSKWIYKTQGGKGRKNDSRLYSSAHPSSCSFHLPYDDELFDAVSLVTWCNNNNHHLQLIGLCFKYGCSAATKLYNTKIQILHSRTHTCQRVLLINSLWVLVFSSINSLKPSLSKKINK